MIDIFATFQDTPQTPSRAPFTITPSDTALLPTLPKAIYVGVGGTVVLRGVDAAADVTYRNVPSGSYLLVRAKLIRATGTTATDLVGEA